VIVVSDTSVILNLCLLGHQDILPSLYEQIITPPEVVAEFTRLARCDRRFIGLQFPTFIAIQSAVGIPLALHTSRLHAGEFAALALATDLTKRPRIGRRGAQVQFLRIRGFLRGWGFVSWPDCR
jgi:predicted nucleic acid-binding protein